MMGPILFPQILQIQQQVTSLLGDPFVCRCDKRRTSSQVAIHNLVWCLHTCIQQSFALKYVRFFYHDSVRNPTARIPTSQSVGSGNHTSENIFMCIFPSLHRFLSIWLVLIFALESYIRKYIYVYFSQSP